MHAAARRAGIEIALASTYRDFETQARIWNEKWTGRRKLVDRGGRTLDANALAPAARVAAILAWSAAPGASRHHWGTDIDLVDRAALAENQRYHLLPEEYAPGGVFHKMRVWLDDNMASFDFFRPYAEYRGGVYAEPWHLSHAPTAAVALTLLTPELIAATVSDSEILGREEVLARLPHIYRTYVTNISSPPAAVA